MDEKSHQICPIFPFIYFINNFYPLLMCTTKLIPYQIACGFRNWNWHHHFPFIVWLVKKIYGLGANWKITESIFFLCKICNKGFHIFPGLVLLIHYIQVTMNLHKVCTGNIFTFREIWRNQNSLLKLSDLWNVGYILPGRT